MTTLTGWRAVSAATSDEINASNKMRDICVGDLSADIPLPVPIPITLDLSLDTTVLTFSVLVSVSAGILFGLAPALQSTNPDLAPTLRDETAGGRGAKGTALRNLLVAGQVSASVVLLIGAGLFSQTPKSRSGGHALMIVVIIMFV